MELNVNKKDREILRELAKRVAEIAALPEMEARKKLWTEHNSLRSKKPIIFISPEGSWGELITHGDMQCEDDEVRRQLEWPLRQKIYYYEHFVDDFVIESRTPVGKAIWNTGWGLTEQWKPTSQTKGARGFDPVITSRDDLTKLKHPEVVYDAEESQKRLAFHQELYGDILDVVPQGVKQISFHLMAQYTKLRGLEQVMMDMVTEPEWLHEAMAFLTEGHQKILRQYEEMNLLELNNDNMYHNSGGNGWTDELPPDDFDPNHVRLKDMWGSAEAQELAQVGPAMHREFSLDYEKQLLQHFGLNGYGCCEDLSQKMPDVLTIPNIRRISISPFASVEKCAEQLQGNYIFSWKPHPSHLVGHFDEDAIRKYIRHTIDVCEKNGCVLEMILKDTHTCENHPERFDRWTQIAREEVER
ncbi:MAG: hypothetical protein ACLFUS_17980 [Candidatus Sumerlaeia bacterium]